MPWLLHCEHSSFGLCPGLLRAPLASASREPSLKLNSCMQKTGSCGIPRPSSVALPFASNKKSFCQTLSTEVLEPALLRLVRARVAVTPRVSFWLGENHYAAFCATPVLRSSSYAFGMLSFAKSGWKTSGVVTIVAWSLWDAISVF